MPSGAPPDSSIRILLADQRQLFASAVHSRLASHPRLELVGVALDGEQAVTLASELAPDIVVLDAELPGVDGPEAMRRICDATGPRMIIVAGADPEVEAHDLGASALLPKARSAADLVEMLEFTALLLDAADSLPAPG